MIFNKKKAFLYSSILLLILISVYFTTIVDSIGFAVRNPVATTVNATGESNATQCPPGAAANLCGSLYTDLLNWTRGGNTELFVFKINIDNYSSVIANQNITRINITLPSGVSGPTILITSTNATFGTGSPIVANNWTGNVTDGTYVTFFNYSTSANAGQPTMGVNGSYREIFLSFNATAANGTESVVNWTVTLYNSTGGGPNYVLDNGLGLLTGIDGLAPRLSSTNVTDIVNTVSSFSGTQYLQYNPSSTEKGINISLTLSDYNIDRVILVYNNSGGTVNITALRKVYQLFNFSTFNQSQSNSYEINGRVLENPNNLGKANVTTLITRSDLSLASTPAYVFMFNISNLTWGEFASDGKTFRYVFVVYDLLNNSEIINNSNANYVIARDVDSPSASITAPTSTGIDTSNPIKYTCTCSDSASGTASCTMTLSKPGGSTVTRTSVSGSEQTFTGTDTSAAGTYNVDCSTTDNVGRSGSASQKSFTASYASGVSGGGGGGSGGSSGGSGSPGTTATNPIVVNTGVTSDLGTLSTSEKYTSVSAAASVKFIAGGGEHSVKVLTITSNSVTIELASTPQQLTLNVGDTKEADLDANGKNDLSIMLKSITNGKADLVFKSLTEAVTPTTPEQPSQVTGEQAKSNSTWIWVIVALVVAALIWFFSKKKK